MSLQHQDISGGGRETQGTSSTGFSSASRDDDEDVTTHARDAEWSFSEWRKPAELAGTIEEGADYEQEGCEGDERDPLIELQQLAPGDQPQDESSDYDGTGSAFATKYTNKTRRCEPSFSF